jgi:hypothetical protein
MTNSKTVLYGMLGGGIALVIVMIAGYLMKKSEAGKTTTVEAPAKPA